MEQIARQANRASPKLGIFRIVHKFLAETNGPPLEEFRNKSDIKRWILTTASREWKAKVKRDLDFDKFESADKFEALDIKLASALKHVLSTM